jgi:hypothetical protein
MPILQLQVERGTTPRSIDDARKRPPILSAENYFCVFSGVTTPTSVFGDKLVDFTSLAFIEQHEPPSFFALAVVAQAAAFSVEHSFDAFEAVVQWSSDTFFTAAVDFVAQHDDPALAFVADVVEHDSPLPANASVTEANRPAATIEIVRTFMWSSSVENLCVVFLVLVVQNRTSQAFFAKEFACQRPLCCNSNYVVFRTKRHLPASTSRA